MQERCSSPDAFPLEYVQQVNVLLLVNHIEAVYFSLETDVVSARTAVAVQMGSCSMA